MLATSAQIVFILFMSALLLVVVFKLLGGQINTRGLLEDKETSAVWQKYSFGYTFKGLPV